MLVFLGLGIYGTMLAWSNAGAMSQFCPSDMSEHRYQSFLVLLVNMPVSLLTGIAYRAMRWKSNNAPGDSEGVQAITAADSEHSTGEDAGQNQSG